jgi:hypothetical protein
MSNLPSPPAARRSLLGRSPLTVLPEISIFRRKVASLRALGTILKSPRSETVAPLLSITFLSPLPSSIITIQALRLSSIAHSLGQNAKVKSNRS